MILKDLSFALRNLRRNKLLAAINVVGLSIGISACLVIFLIASYELSFDTFQPDRDRVYRVYTTFSGVFNGTNHGLSTGAAGHIKDNFSGLEAVTNFHSLHGRVKVPDNHGNDKDFGNYSQAIIAGPEYFDVFRYYEWVVGGPKQSLTDPFKVVITESRAKIYFGDLDPLAVIGKEIHYRDSLVVTVSGIVKDVKERTDLDFTDFISFSTIEKSWIKENIPLNNWDGTNSSSQVFVRLAPGTAVEKIQSQIPQLSEIYQQHSENPEWKTTPKLQALADLHFSIDIGIFDHSRSVAPRSTLQILILVAFLLLIIASINFINLETAQASRHAKEVGVRKVLGSSRSKLIFRFLVQSFILATLSAIVSVFFVAFSLQYFTEYIPKGLVFDLSDPSIAIFLVSSSLAVTLLAGLYPALVLSSYQPALALKNLAFSNSAASRSGFIRKSLTVFQFSFSQVLIIVTIAIGLQVQYMLDKDLGFNTDSVVTVSTSWWEKKEKALIFRNALAQIPEIEMFTMNGAPPISSTVHTSTISFEEGEDILRHNVHIKQGDTAYLHVYGLSLLAGRNVLPRDSADEYLINEKYMQLLGFDDPRDVLGKTLDKKLTIVGVVKNFHTQSLRADIPPTAIRYAPHAPHFGIKFATPRNKVSDLEPALEKIEAAWKKTFPDEPFQYSFMSNNIKRFYETEQRTRKLAGVSTCIAILISCLGLFGLSSFTVIQRTKEIGVRKVLGATVNSILFLLSKDFLKLVMVAFILSMPVAYYLADRWLEGFAYRTDLTAWIFVLSGLFSVVIAFITISFRTVSAAKSDPVKSLRYE